MKRFIIAGVLMIGAFGYLLITGMKEGSMYYLEVSEYINAIEDLKERKVRVHGRVDREKIAFEEQTSTLLLFLKDTKGNEFIKVKYKGPPPDLLTEEGVTVVVEGRYNPEEDLFVARRLLVKCPSKYEKGSNT